MTMIKKFKPSTVYFLLTFSLFSEVAISSSAVEYHKHIGETDLQRDKKCVIGRDKINILTIDGGGVRGIIPAVFLQKLEEDMAPRPTRQIFNLVAGTSTGAILSLGLVTPKNTNTAPNDDFEYHTAKEMVALYRDLSNDIFPSKNFVSRWTTVLPSYLWWGSQYSEVTLEKRLDDILGERQLNQLTCPTIITSVDTRFNTLKLFRSYRAQWKLEENFYIKDIARATSAAPTIFTIAKIRNVTKNQNNEQIRGRTVFPLVDGGMAANNPAMVAFTEARNLFGNNAQINLISLGTGNEAVVHEAKDIAYFRRPTPTIDMLFDTQSDTVHKNLYTLSQTLPNLKYFRVQIPLEKKLMQLDNANNIRDLEGKAVNFLENEGNSQFKEIINTLY